MNLYTSCLIPKNKSEQNSDGTKSHIVDRKFFSWKVLYNEGDKPIVPFSYKKMENPPENLHISENISISQVNRPDPIRDKIMNTDFGLLICVTIYNETVDDLEKTLEGIINNIKNSPGTEFPISSEKVGVVLIFDGLQHVHDSILEDENLLEDEIAEKLKIYKGKLEKQRDYFDKELLKKGAQLHISERSHEGKNFYLIFCFKFYNGKKLDSHKWFLRGFCNIVKTVKYFAFIDCGAQPEEHSIINLIKPMEYDDKLAGTCGFMSLYKQSILNEHSLRHDEQWFKKLDFVSKFCDKIFCVQEAQIFEYSFSHIFDKAFESLFGFIQVLPGAFSCYRWDAVKAAVILDEYVPKSGQKSNRTLRQENRLLAEDRILCLSLFLQEGRSNILKYIPNSVVRVDPIIHLVNLMNQRKRWINGSLCAMLDVIGKVFCCKMRRTNHGFVRLFFFGLLMIYNSIMIGISYCILGLYFVYLEILTSQYFSEIELFTFSKQFTRLSDLIMFLYICLVGSLLFYSIYYKAKDRPEKFYRASNILGIFMLLSFGFGAYVFISYVIQEDISNFRFLELKAKVDSENIGRPVLRLLILINIVSYILPFFFNGSCIKDAMVSGIHYVFYSPTYIHNLVIYAYCNFDDISWGTKGLDAKDVSKNFKEYKMKFVASWIFINILIAYVLTCLCGNDVIRVNFLLWTTYFYTAILAIRSFASFIFHLKFYFWDY